MSNHGKLVAIACQLSSNWQIYAGTAIACGVGVQELDQAMPIFKWMAFLVLLVVFGASCDMNFDISGIEISGNVPNCSSWGSSECNPPVDRCVVAPGATQSGGVNGEVVAVPAGAFPMGCDPAMDPACELGEQPLHTVTLAAFEIDRTEVTQMAYGKCVDAGICTPPAECFEPAVNIDYPVVGVTWEQAETYCESLGRRLPTEAEWEKAARGTDGRLFPWGAAQPDCTLANFAVCATGQIPGKQQWVGGVMEPVGSHPTGASPYGALDMAGNVLEWVHDWYDSNYYASSPAADPTGPATDPGGWGGRGVRGGTWGYPASSVRGASRSYSNPSVATSNIGFRCAKSIP